MILILLISKTSTIVTDDVKTKIKELFPLAPIHNPNNLMGINFIQEKFPDLTQVAVFDTSFHVSSMPAKAYRYQFFSKILFFHIGQILQELVYKISLSVKYLLLFLFSENVFFYF